MSFGKKQNNIIQITKKSINFACLNIKNIAYEKSGKDPGMVICSSFIFVR